MNKIQFKTILLSVIIFPFILLYSLSCSKKVDKTGNNNKDETDSVTIVYPYEEEILAGIERPAITDVYEYPVRPGTAGWSELTTQEERFNALQIPDSVLINISTWGLAITCFNYPLYGDFIAFNDPIVWINSHCDNFKGLKELFTREDVTELFLHLYRDYYVKGYNVYNLCLYRDSFNKEFIELLVGSDRFVSKLEIKQSIFLVAVALEKAKEQRKYHNSDITGSAFIMGNIMFHSGYRPFIDYSSLVKEQSYGRILKRFNSSPEKIEEFAMEFVKL